jgi:hypothetical protein
MREKFRFDRTAFWAGKHEDNEKRTKDFWFVQSASDRLNAACYLNSVAYNYSIDSPPSVNRTIFSMRKHEA